MRREGEERKGEEEREGGKEEQECPGPESNG
jgi:hypothetical protein